MQMYIISGIIILLIILYIFAYNKLARLSIKVEEGSSGINVALEKRYDMLSEQIEVVKRFLQHEYDTYTAITEARSGNELKEQELKQKEVLSKEAIKTIDDTINMQQKQMDNMKKQMQISRGFRKQKQKRDAKQQAYEASAYKKNMSVQQKIRMLSSIHQGLGGVRATIDALVEQYPVLYSHVSVEYFQRSIADAEEHLQAARRLYNSNVSLYNQKIVMFPYSIVASIHGMDKADFYDIEEKKKSYQIKFN